MFLSPIQGVPLTYVLLNWKDEEGPQEDELSLPSSLAEGRFKMVLATR